MALANDPLYMFVQQGDSSGFNMFVSINGPLCIQFHFQPPPGAYTSIFMFIHQHIYSILAHLSPRRQHTWHSFLSSSIHSIPTTQKWLSKAQIQHFMSSHVSSPITHPFRWQPLDFYSTYPFSDTFQPCQDDQWLPPSQTTVDNLSNATTSVHDIPSVSPPTSLRS